MDKWGWYGSALTVFVGWGSRKGNKMAEEAIEGPPPIRTEWRHHHTVFAEVPLGHSHAAGVTRLVMGEIAFNEEPGATLPKYQPVFTLAIPNAAIPSLIAYLQDIVEKQNGNG